MALITYSVCNIKTSKRFKIMFDKLDTENWLIAKVWILPTASGHI